jgi:para-aminobenzoate synthetase component 1
MQQFQLEINLRSNFINIDSAFEQFENVCIYNSNSKKDDYDLLIALGSADKFTSSSTTALKELEQFIRLKNDWLFGYISYDVKNQIEKLTSKNDDLLGFPLIHFFCPQILIEVKNGNCTIYFDEKNILEEDARVIALNLLNESIEKTTTKNNVLLQQKISREEYITQVNLLKKHIQLGNIYEVNFCQEFFASNANINIASTYKELNAISEAPFSACCKFNNQYVISASPERFLKRVGTKLISQPIKGTSKRYLDKNKDDQAKEELKNNPKEQSENVMIVDLVRNDLSQIAERGSTIVDELFGVYTFKQVHHLISTISCEIKQETSFENIIRATFPMGSMTGAPKVSAMKLIESHEVPKRGLYSGCLGFIKPNGDFDFSVVIRSILYDEETKNLSFMVGSAITSNANAEDEYEECMTKANALIKVLTH